MSLLASLENFFNEYIFEPLFDEGISDLYEDSILQDIVQYPIYDRNTNATLIVKSTHPSPATLHTLTWEGIYNNNFYQRV